MVKLICEICGSEKDVPSCCDQSMMLKESHLLCCCKSEVCDYQQIPKCCGQHMTYNEHWQLNHKKNKKKKEDNITKLDCK